MSSEGFEVHGSVIGNDEFTQKKLYTADILNETSMFMIRLEF